MATVDITPTWIGFLNMVKHGILNIKDAGLETPCRVMDAIVQARKNGKCEFVVTINEDGSISYDDGVTDGN